MSKYTAALIFNRDKTEVLLVENNKTGNKSIWAPPGGKLEDETPLGGMIREVREEVSLNIPAENFDFLNKYIGTLEYKVGRFEVYFYVVEEFEGKPKAGDDALDFKWFQIREILSSEEENLFFSNKVKFNLSDNTKKALKEYFLK